MNYQESIVLDFVLDRKIVQSVHDSYALITNNQGGDNAVAHV
ncbi:hypothetical protein [Pseudoalteromonas sp. MSK9-3]|nr:hypothetical protein [Pseudoalteromonas sp. MSK9-3]